MNTILSEWEEFRRLVLPESTPEPKLREMKRVFFAGASVVLKINLIIGRQDISEDAGVAILQSLNEECWVFAEDILAGKA